MDSEIVDAVTEWDSRSFTGGYAGLHDLADEGFTGAVTDGMTWLFMLNGRAVGVFDGSIESFEDASGTAYVAPARALPLLFTMKETGGETRAKYYTNDTSLSEADATLSSGSFTGYIELSENVLSGDYYVVYHGGRSMSVAFVGNSRQLITGEEAFEKADDEVGIYEVKDVDIDVIEIPNPEPAIDEAENGPESEPDSDSDSDTDVDSASLGVADVVPDDVETASESTDAAADADDSVEPRDATTEDPVESASEDTDEMAAAPDDTSDAESAADADAETEMDSPESATDAQADATGEPESSEVDAESEAPTETLSDADAASAGAPASEPTAGSEDTAADAEPDSADVAAGLTDAVQTDTAPDTAGEDSDGQDDAVFSEEEEWREARSIPSLNPAKSSTDPESNAQSTAQRPRQSSDTAASGKQRPRPSSSQRESPQRESPSNQQAPQSQQLEQLRERLQAAQQAKEEAESETERLAAEREELQQTVEELQDERDRYQERAEQLEARVDELETQIQRLEEQLEDAKAAGPGSAPDRTMSRQAVLDGTNLFVRYGSKGGATLEKAHKGEADRQEVAQNLRLEHHSSFETEGLHVEGKPYEEFLHDTIEYKFARWVVTELLYEIQDTGHEVGLRELYDAIPQIDRAELHGQASVAYQENGEEHREQQSFDVILRDRMGNPLVVADVNESRDPATEGMMTSLVENARRVKESSDSLGAAVFVTASFFEPGALETAADATGGGLLSRSKRESFVKLSRKNGFHLCLVETRNGDFHVNVPEL